MYKRLCIRMCSLMYANEGSTVERQWLEQAWDHEMWFQLNIAPAIQS